MKFKKFSLVALSALSIFLFASCGKKKDTPSKVTDNNKVTDNVVEEDEKQRIYKLAQQAGFTGTYEEWLASIKGADGKGIKSIVKTKSEGLVDTFTITFTDDTTTTFEIKNGSTDDYYVSIISDYDETIKEIIEIDERTITKTYQKFVGEWVNTKKRIYTYNFKKELVGEENYSWDEEDSSWEGTSKYGYLYTEDNTTTFYYNWVDAESNWELSSKDIEEEIDGNNDEITYITESYDYDADNDSWIPYEKTSKTYDDEDDEIFYIHYSWASGLNDWSEDYLSFQNKYFETKGRIEYDWNNEENGWVDATMTISADLYREEDYYYEYVILTLDWSDSEQKFVLSTVEEKNGEEGDTISYTDNPGDYGEFIWKKEYYSKQVDSYTNRTDVITYDYMLDLDNFAIRPYEILEHSYYDYIFGYGPGKENVGYGIEISKINCKDWNNDELDWGYKEVITSTLDDYEKVITTSIVKYINGVEEKVEYDELYYDEYDRLDYNYVYVFWSDDINDWEMKYHNIHSYDSNGRNLGFTQYQVIGDEEIPTLKLVYTYDDVNEKITTTVYQWNGTEWVE